MAKSKISESELVPPYTQGWNDGYKGLEIDSRMKFALKQVYPSKEDQQTYLQGHKEGKADKAKETNENIKEATAMTATQKQIDQLKSKIAEAKFAKMTVPALAFKGKNAKTLVGKFNESFGVDFSIDESKKKIINLSESAKEYTLFNMLGKFLGNKGVATQLVEYDNNKFSHLLEGELEKAQVVLAAKDILASLQKIAEDITKIQTDAVMPLVDEIKVQFGPEISQNFENVSKSTLDASFDAVRTAKDQIGDEVAKLQTVVDGGEYPTDIAMDDGMGDAGLDGLGDGDVEAGLDTPEVDLDAGDMAGAFAGDAAENPLGREKKESISNKKPAIKESKKKK